MSCPKLWEVWSSDLADVDLNFLPVGPQHHGGLLWQGGHFEKRPFAGARGASHLQLETILDPMDKLSKVVANSVKILKPWAMNCCMAQSPKLCSVIVFVCICHLLYRRVYGARCKGIAAVCKRMAGRTGYGLRWNVPIWDEAAKRDTDVRWCAQL